MAIAATKPIATWADTKVPPAFARIDWRQVPDVGKRRLTELAALLSGSSFVIRRPGARLYVYFGKAGEAWLWDRWKPSPERGAWMIALAKRGWDFICWTPGRFPEDMTARNRADPSSSVGDFVGFADYLSRGDVFAVTSGRAPE